MNLGAEITVIETKREAIIIATKTEPYKSPIDFTSKFPEENMDYLIMYKNTKGTFSGKLCNVRIDQIELLQR